MNFAELSKTAGKRSKQLLIVPLKGFFLEIKRASNSILFFISDIQIWPDASFDGIRSEDYQSKEMDTLSDNQDFFSFADISILNVTFPIPSHAKKQCVVWNSFSEEHSLEFSNGNQHTLKKSMSTQLHKKMLHPQFYQNDHLTATLCSPAAPTPPSSPHH